MKLKNWRSGYGEIGDVTELTNRKQMEFASDAEYEEWVAEHTNNNEEVA